MNAPISITRSGSAAVLRMAHGKANAMDVELLRALRAGFAEIASSDARSMVLIGSGTIFSAGVDLRRLLQGGRAYLEEFLPELSACFRELFVFAKPAVAAVNGHAIAGGCLLSCACDHRIMARGSGRIGIPELKVGVPFPLVPLEIARFALPRPIVQEAVLTGRTYDVDTALARGVVDVVVEPERLLGKALEVAEEMGALTPASFARTKRDLRRPVVETWERHAAAHDAETLERWASAEVQEAVRVFVEKTLAKSTGRV